MEGARAQATQLPGRPLATPVGGPEAVRTAVTRTLRTAGSELSLVLSCSLEDRRLAPPALLAEAVARGVRVRVVQDLGNGPGVAQQLARTGADVRTAARIPSRMLIADRRVALVLPPADAGPAAPAVATGRSALLSALVAHFELLWEISESTGPATSPAMRTRDTEILQLLASGMTDDAVAAHMGSSARTIRRRVAALMRETSAKTRFQAGVEAVRRGWL